MDRLAGRRTLGCYSPSMPDILAILESCATNTRMIPRRLYSQLHDLLSEYPAVALIESYRITPDTEAVPLLDLGRQVSRAT